MHQDGIQLRDRSNKIIEDTLKRALSSANKITLEVREKIKEQKLNGQVLVIGQLEKVSEAAQAGNQAIQGP